MMLRVSEFYLMRASRIDGLEAFSLVIKNIDINKKFILKSGFFSNYLNIKMIESIGEIFKRNFISIVEVAHYNEVSNQLNNYYEMIENKKSRCIDKDIFANYELDDNVYDVLRGMEQFIITHHDFETIYIVQRISS